MIKAKEKRTSDELPQRFGVGRTRVVRWSKRIHVQQAGDENRYGGLKTRS